MTEKAQVWTWSLSFPSREGATELLPSHFRHALYLGGFAAQRGRRPLRAFLKPAGLVQSG